MSDIDFKNWLEHYGGKYPEKGDFIEVLKPKTIVAGTMPKEEGPIHLPIGNYLVVNINHKNNMYMVKSARDSSKMYFLGIDDVDEAIERGELKAD